MYFSILMIKNLVDNIWNCGCGAMNAAYRTTCGKCNKKRHIEIMDGVEIINRLKEIRVEVSNVNLKSAMRKIDYLVDDIFMYKNNSL